MTDTMTTTITTPTENARARQLRERAERDYSALSTLGLTTGETFYPPGTEVLSRSAITRARTKFEELPHAELALTELKDAVLREDRQDLPCVVGPMHPHEGKPAVYPSVMGGLTSWNGSDVVSPRYALTNQSMAQVLALQPDELRGHIPGPDVHSWWNRVPLKDMVLRHRAMPQGRANIRAEREAYALVTPNYKPYDLDAAAADLLDVLPDGSRARVRYDGARARVDVVLQNPYKVDGGDGAAVGETHRVVLRMRTADDGSGGYHLSLLAERVRCVNLTLLHASKSLLSATHRSDDLRQLAQQALEAVEPTFKLFADQWRDAWNVHYSDRYTRGGISGEEALRRIVLGGKFSIRGLGKDGTLAAVLKAMEAEPGDTKAHVHNALTRAAHESPVSWASRWADDEAEEQASQLLYARVLTLSDPSPEELS